MTRSRQSSIPTSEFAGMSRIALLGLLPLIAFVAWGVWHALAVMQAFDGHGNRLATAWALSFLLLWWVPLAWLERPVKATPRQQAQLDLLYVAVQIPAYNEDESALRLCIQSLFDQTRRPNRIYVVDDGSKDKATDRVIDYAEIRRWFLTETKRLGIHGVWDRQVNQGKRHAQANSLRREAALLKGSGRSEIFMTLDSDSVLDRKAVEEGLKPFSDPRVHSVAGHVVVLNSRDNVLTFMTSMLYLPFTRGLRSAQSVLKRVMVNSGTLAFYRTDTLLKYLGVYENERFRGKPMQMNDDSLMTMYALLAEDGHGKAVHQPSSVCFTLVPNKVQHYLNQQFRWMRGTFVRTFWWFKYMRITSITFWMPVMELTQLILSLVIPVALVQQTRPGDLMDLVWSTMWVGLGVNYVIALRFFSIDRSDEPAWFRWALFITSPVTAIWRLLILRPMYFYALFTCWKIGKWGTRDSGVEVGMKIEPKDAVPA